MTPSVLLPRKDKPISRRPKDLLVRHDIVKYTATTMFRTEYLAGGTGFRIGHMNGPWLPFSFRTKRERAPHSGNTQVRNVSAVRRPNRIRIAVHGWIEIEQLPIAGSVNNNEAVIAASAHEYQR